MSGYDPLDLLGQEEAHKLSAEQRENRAKVDAQDFKWVVSNKRGRRFVMALLERSGVFRSSFTGNSQTFFNEGQRNIGLSVLAMIHMHSPETYALMLSEQRDHERNNERSSEH